MKRKDLILFSGIVLLSLILTIAIAGGAGFFGPKSKAIHNCKEYLIKNMQGYGWENGYKITQSKAFYNDPEVSNVSYPITVIIEVRMNGPIGYKKGYASFACLADGSIMQPMQMPEYGP